MSARAILHLVNVLSFGGAEGQFLERVRSTNRDRWRPIVGALKAQGPHLAELARLGLAPREFCLGPSLAHPNTVKVIVALARTMRRERVRLVHAQDFYTNLLAVPAARLAGAKVIVSRLDLAHWHGPRRRRALALASRLADGVQANAEAIRELLVREEGLDPARVTVVMNGIDLERFDERLRAPLEAPLPVPEGATIAVIVANLHPIKGQHDAIAALARLRPTHPSLHLVLVGEGERRAPLMRLATKAGVADRVHLLGHRTDVPALLARSTLLLSTSDAEGLSNSIIEGLAARLPVIATKVGGSPELLGDGARGRLVAARAPEALARAMHELLEDEPRRLTLGAAGRKFVEARLELRRMARGFDALYEEVLDGSAARSYAGGWSPSSAASPSGRAGSSVGGVDRTT